MEPDTQGDERVACDGHVRQVKQAVSLVWLAKVPVRQDWQAVWYVDELNVPRLQERHVELAVAPEAVEYCPVEHARQDALDMELTPVR